MRLLRLELKRFGRFEDYTIDCADGINVLLGDNESGKSTVVAAVCAALFDDPAQLQNEMRRYNHWASEHPFLLHLEFEANGKVFHLTKDISTQLTLLEDISSGTKWNNQRDVQAQVAAALGFGEKEFFLASACAQQGDLAGVSRAVNLVKDKLERLINSNKDEVLASRLLERLSTRIAALEGKGDGAGEIAQLEKKIAGWQAELQTCKGKTAELLEYRNRVYTNAVELQKTEQRFNDQHERFRKSKLAFEAAQVLDKDRELYMDLSRKTLEAQDIKNQITSKKDTLKSLIRIERADQRSCEGLATQKQVYEGRVQDCEARVTEAHEKAQEATPKSWYRYVTIAALIGALGAAAVWYFLRDPLLLGSAAAALIVSGSALALWFSAKGAYAQALRVHDDAKRRLEEERENLRKNSETLDALLRRFKAKDVDELAEKYEQYRDLDRDIKAMVSRYESIIGENNLKDLELDLARMNERMAEQQQIFDQHRAYAVTERDLEELQREVAELDKKLTRLRDEGTLAGHKLEFLESGTDIMAPLQERIEDGQRKLEAFRREAEQLKIVARYLEEARRKVLKSSIEMLEDEASAILSQITIGTWNKVRLDRHHLTCEISHDGVGWRSAADHLSRSASDALYLALRLALVKVLCGDNRPPLIFDEPLVNLDAMRRKEALRILRQFAANYQVLLLTADESAREAGDQFRHLGSLTRQVATV
ncbi:MAG: AAA family ATPase [candidate division Zixibacteria bacterium]|nr:AAA family ATPase [candidate division Zixibacteria bacterium]